MTQQTKTKVKDMMFIKISRWFLVGRTETDPLKKPAVEVSFEFDLKALVETAGLRSAGRLFQRRKPAAS